MRDIDGKRKDRLIRFAEALIDQQRARTIVAPQRAEPGYWFGGGNMAESADGVLYVVGRYRNAGDSRTGLAAGERGLELAIFASHDRGATFEKVVSFDKSELGVGDRTVYSIEGAALRIGADGVELFVSTEKAQIGYPEPFTAFLKPGTGVWTIDRLAAASIDELKDESPQTVLASDDPRYIHIKDPFLYERDEQLYLLFCNHPYCWTSSGTGYAVRRGDAALFESPHFDCVPRGVTWDVAMTRGTCLVDVPSVGPFAGNDLSLLFYDGGECVRNHDPHGAAVDRPRGYSCEEIGGVGFCRGGDVASMERLSVYQPLFVSPHGTGCSRYIDVHCASDGWYATWQQAQADGSQPLVMHFLPAAAADDILSR